MAGVNFYVNSGEVSVNGSTTKTILQIKAPTNQRVLVRGIRVYGKAAAGGTDTPCKVRLTRNSANFGTGSAATPSKNDPNDGETIQTTANSNFTVEPTSPTDAGYWNEVQPQSGIIDYFPPDRPIEVPGGQSLQVEVTTPTATAQTLLATLMCEE